MVLLLSINPSMDVGHLLDEGWCHHRYIGHIVATSSTARLAASTGSVVWGITHFLKDSQ